MSTRTAVSGPPLPVAGLWATGSCGPAPVQGAAASLRAVGAPGPFAYWRARLLIRAVSSVTWV
jgi:hypothetical protein